MVYKFQSKTRKRWDEMLQLKQQGRKGGWGECLLPLPLVPLRILTGWMAPTLGGQSTLLGQWIEMPISSGDTLPDNV